METAQCPACGEDILAAAKKCKHCGEWVGSDIDAENTTTCPICAEVINTQVKVCPHCKERIDTECEIEPVEEDVEEESDGLKNYIARPIQALIGYLLFYFGGWHLVAPLSFDKLKAMGLSASFALKEWRWQMPQSWDSLLFNDAPSFLLGPHSFLIQINDSYYGFICTPQFFDAPFIQAMMLSCAICGIINAVINFIFNFNDPV